MVRRVDVCVASDGFFLNAWSVSIKIVPFYVITQKKSSPHSFDPTELKQVPHHPNKYHTNQNKSTMVQKMQNFRHEGSNLGYTIQSRG